jgi:tRNA A37 threonylcarbamoyladenosine synthetase subunit TsaC/SUA5/YrdC
LLSIRTSSENRYNCEALVGLSVRKENEEEEEEILRVRARDKDKG